MDRINEETGGREYLSEDFLKERRRKNRAERKNKRARKKEQANYPMKASEFHQNRPLEEILREKGLDEEEIERVEHELEDIVEDIVKDLEDIDDHDQ